ncbi:RNA polymerase sigma factor [Streptomyces monomycini]|uniref:RNA polymerase sigma factor n=1 Tax=Streptomyces monomycini TaxID=371720 RepID=UPI00067AA34F|nr:RNA polymerase sigma factor [Streptomyces monomycini]
MVLAPGVELAPVQAIWEPQVRRYLLWLEGGRSIIEDAARKTMISAHRHWLRVRQLEKPKAWLFKVAGQRLHDAHEARLRQGITTAPQDLPDRPAAHRDEYAARTDSMVLVEVVRKLPPQQAKAVTLYYFYDLKCADIADIMELATGTVKSDVHHACSALGSLLGEDDEGEELR